MENEDSEMLRAPERKETVVYRETVWSKVLGVSLVALYVSFALLFLGLTLPFALASFVSFYSFVICKECRDSKFARIGYFLVILWLIVSNILSLIPDEQLPNELLFTVAVLDFVALFSFFFIFENEVGRGAVRPNIFFWLAMASLLLTYAMLALTFVYISLLAVILAGIFKVLYITFISIGKSARTYEVRIITSE